MVHLGPRQSPCRASGTNGLKMSVLGAKLPFAINGSI